MTTVVLVRHGQTALNLGGRIRGQLDPPLDDTGIRQAQVTARYIASRWPVAAVYSSPLRRAHRTAKAIATTQGLVPTPIGGLLDLDFGEWHGLSFEETQVRYPDIHEGWNTTPYSVHFPGGECLDDVHARAMHAVGSVAAGHREETVAMVGHTVVNRVIVCAVLGVSSEAFWSFGQDTCSVSTFEVSSDGEMLLTLLNDTSHLKGLDSQ